MTDRTDSLLSPVYPSAYDRTMDASSVDAFDKLESRVYAALETYSNVHRGSGHYSNVTTQLYEQARKSILEFLGLPRNQFLVLFCSPRSAAILKHQLPDGSYHVLASKDISLPLGVVAIAVKRNTLPKGKPFLTGGGTTRLISRNWVLWASAPDRFEAGTPAIINVIAFAIALRIIRESGKPLYPETSVNTLTGRQILFVDDLQSFTGKELLDQLRQNLIGRKILVPTAFGESPFINFDNAASTPAFEPVWNAVRQTWQHDEVVRQDVIRETRDVCSQFLGAPSDVYDLIFTSNTTEAINLAAESFSREIGKDHETVVLSTLLEHSSNDLPWRTIPGVKLLRISIDADGFPDLAAMESLLRDYNQLSLYASKRISLVAMSGASNVLGTYTRLEEISRLAHLYGARLFVDAAQLVAHAAVSMHQAGIDYLVFSAHKVYAPFGSGALIVRKGLLQFRPDEMEEIRQSGEENAGGIAGLGKAMVLLQRIGMETIRQEEKKMTTLLLQKMNKIPGIRMYGITDASKPGFSNRGGVIAFSMKGIQPNKIASELALRGGIGIRYGCHCSHLLIKHLLGVPRWAENIQRLILQVAPRMRLPGLARISLGIENTDEEVNSLIKILENMGSKEKHSEKEQSGNRQTDLGERMKNYALQRVDSVFYGNQFPEK